MNTLSKIVADNYKLNKIHNLASKTFTVLENILPYLIIVSIFFQVRYVFETKSAFIIGEFSNFTAISLYLSDIIIFSYFVIILINKKNLYLSTKIAIIFSLYLLLNLLIPRQVELLHVYTTCKMILLIILWVNFKISFDFKKAKNYLNLFLILCIVQVVIELGQFSLQNSLGLKSIGESVISIFGSGIAKILAEGLVFIRPYGTLPHPNVLSAILTTGLMISLFFLYNTWSNPWKKVLHGTILAMLTIGIILTFSRAAILASIIGSSIFLLLTLIKSKNFKKLIFAGLILFITSVSCVTILKPLLLIRANIFDQATKERRIYVNVGTELIKKYSLTGVGTGLSILYVNELSDTDLEKHQIQPIHNYFLILAAEIGLIGLLIWLIFSFSIFTNLIKNIKHNTNSEITDDPELQLLHITLLSVLTSYFVLMMFDHYFYTINQTQILLWTILGLGAGITARENKKPALMLAGKV